MMTVTMMVIKMMPMSEGNHLDKTNVRSGTLFYFTSYKIVELVLVSYTVICILPTLLSMSTFLRM
jgi:hypothetical protein